VTAKLTGRHQYRDRALFVLGLKSGRRITCLLSLRIEDVYDGAMLKHIKVRRHTVKGKRAGFRTPSTAAAVVEEYIQHRGFGLPGDTPLFRSNRRNGDGSCRSAGGRLGGFSSGRISKPGSAAKWHATRLGRRFASGCTPL
jgi:integrase